MLLLAKQEDVDMVLLGGDLFHDNKPQVESTLVVDREQLFLAPGLGRRCIRR